MKNIQSKIGILIFLVLLGIIAVMYFSLDPQREMKIKFIDLSGSSYLESDSYIRFAKLNPKDGLQSLTLGLIKDRFEKHPYVAYADVRYDGKGKVSIKIHEKNFKAIMIYEGSEYLVDEKLELNPLLRFTKNIDLPVILGVKEKISGKRNKRLLKAMKLISAAEISNHALAADISEIEFGKKERVTVRFIYNDYLLNLGAKNIVYKLAAFGGLYEKLNSDSGVKNLDYIDMRFEDQICLGFKEAVPSNGDTKI